MASDLSNKEIEDGIKKILFSKGSEDASWNDKYSKTDLGADSADNTAMPTSSPNRRNKERPKPKNDKWQPSKSNLSDTPDSVKTSQGNCDGAIGSSDRVKKDGKPRKDRNPHEKPAAHESTYDPNNDTGDQSHPDHKRKRNRGKKKKKPSESPDNSAVKSLSDNTGRPAKSPSPKPDNSKNKRISKADEIYKQNVASLASKNPYMNDVYNPSTLMELEKEFLYPLKKRSLKFPTAKFFCRLCEYHCDTVGICERHVKDTRHQRLKTIKTTDILLRSLPEPRSIHIQAVDALLERIVKEQSVTEQELEARKIVFERIKSIIHKVYPNTWLKLYGSTLIGSATKDSDINIDISMDDSPKVLLDVHRLLKEDSSGYFKHVKSEFSAKVPCFNFMASELNTKCQVAVSNALSVKTSELMAVYADLDPRVNRILVLFRYWSKLCRIDRQEEGTLPAYVFSLMAIYFLQQTQPPVLPVLHELVSLDKSAKSKPGNEHRYVNDVNEVAALWKTDNTHTVGELWIKLLRFYAVQFDMAATVICIRQRQPLARQEKKWASKKLAIEDPFFRKRNVARTLSHSQVFEYINDRIRAAFRYFGIPQTPCGPVFTDIDPIKLEKKLEENLRSQGESPSTPDMNSNRKPCVPQSEADGTSQSPKPACSATSGSQTGESEDTTNGPCEDTGLAGAMRSLSLLGKEDTTAEVSNGDCSEASPAFITKRIIDELIEEVTTSEAGVLSDMDSCPSPSVSSRSPVEGGGEHEQVDSPGTDQLSPDAEPLLLLPKDEENRAVYSSGDDDSKTSGPVPSDNKVAPASRLEDDDDQNEERSSTSSAEPAEVGDDDTPVLQGKNAKYAHTKTSKFLKNVNTPTMNGPDINLFDESVLAGLTCVDLSFQFDYETLSDGKGPAVMCGICQREGHLKHNCPEEQLPELEPLPNMTKDFKDMLDQVLRGVPNDFEPSQSELMMRQQVLRELEHFIRETYQDAQLSLFGSSCNGFGFQYSDLDICLTFDQYKSPEELNCVEVIETLAKKLRKHRGLFNVFAITTAKVPIVKFKHRRTQLDGDISLYNTLAQHNTRMLRMYADIDPRVKVLGYVMKVFAKCCDICDASRGSLSSYAYVLMVLYFLQQRKPPVIPVLQELHDGKKPQCTVDGWNAWFYDDFPSLPKKWPGYGRNRESVGELWVGLLRFYTEEFNFLDYVVSVRYGQQLTRFEKLWNGKCLAIEDPFDLSHNLGSGLSRKMNTYIQKAFRRGRKVFGTPFEFLPRGCPTLQDYFFNADNLTEGQPPNDRGCRICGKIGHFAKECPVIQQRKEWKEKSREQRRLNEDAQSREEDRSLHADSKPQAIPRERSYQRSQSYGHTPPDMGASPGNGPSSLPGSLVYPRSSGGSGSPGGLHGGPQVFYNTNFRAPDPRHGGYSGGSEVQGLIGFGGAVTEGSNVPCYVGMPQSPPVGAAPGAFHFHAPPGSPVALSTSTTAFPAFYYQYVSVANHAASTNAIDTNTNTERSGYRKPPYYPSQSSQYYQPPEWSLSRTGNTVGQGIRQRQQHSPAHSHPRATSGNKPGNLEITVPNERYQRSGSADFKDQPHSGSPQYHMGHTSSPSGQKKPANPASQRSQYMSTPRFSNR